MRLAFLVNPKSGSDASPEELEAELIRSGAHVHRFGPDEVERALDTEPERLVVAGGDGTLAPVAAAAATAGVELAVVPSGTANDFARAVGLPQDVRDACRLAATGRRVLRLDLARMGERPFLNVANGGLPYRAARDAHGLKDALGTVAYTLGGLRSAVVADPVECRVRCDGDTLFEGDAWQVTVANTGAFGAGSGVEADAADGLLDVVVLEAGARARLVLHGAGLRAGRVGGLPGVRTERGSRVDVTLTPPGFNVDGELVNEAEGTFTVEPGAVALVVG